MIIEIHKARPTFKSVLQYANDKVMKDKDGKPITDENGNPIPAAENLGGNTAAFYTGELIKEFERMEKLNPKMKNPVHHFSISLKAGESLTDTEWLDLVKEYLESQGFDSNKHPYTVIKHKDTDKEHVHVVASRIGLDGKALWFEKGNFFKSKEKTRELEKKYGLASPYDKEKQEEKKKSSRPEKERAKRRAKKKAIENGMGKEQAEKMAEEAPTAKEYIQQAIDELIKGNEFDLQTDGGRVFFKEKLKEKKIEVKYQKTGAAFLYDGIAYSGTKLGTDYKFKKLTARALHTEEKRQAEWEKFWQQQEEIREKALKEISAGQEKVKKMKAACDDYYQKMWMFIQATRQAESAIQKFVCELWAIYCALKNIEAMSERARENKAISEKYQERKENTQVAKEKFDSAVQEIKNLITPAEKPPTPAQKQTAQPRAFLDINAIFHQQQIRQIQAETKAEEPPKETPPAQKPVEQPAFQPAVKEEPQVRAAEQKRETPAEKPPTPAQRQTAQPREFFPDINAIIRQQPQVKAAEQKWETPAEKPPTPAQRQTAQPREFFPDINAIIRQQQIRQIQAETAELPKETPQPPKPVEQPAFQPVVKEEPQVKAAEQKWETPAEKPPTPAQKQTAEQESKPLVTLDADSITAQMEAEIAKQMARENQQEPQAQKRWRGR